MILRAFPLLCAAAITLPAASHAAEIQIAVSGPVVELNVSESVAARPDMAEISAGVSTRAPTAVEAMRQNAAAMNRVIDRIKSLGMAEDDIQTSGINLNPQYDYDQQRQEQVFRGYQVSNRVSVIMRDIQQIGPVLDALVAAGATDLGGPNWSASDSSAARDQARIAAMASAQARAISYAQMAGYSGVRLLEVNETIRSDQPQPMMRLQTMDTAERSTPVQPGRVESGVNITVKYEMTR